LNALPLSGALPNLLQGFARAELHAMRQFGRIKGSDSGVFGQDEQIAAMLHIGNRLIVALHFRFIRRSDKSP
jgi:hypothetical protein